MRKSLIIAAAASALLVGGCGGSEDSRVPTAEENQSLNEISATLDNEQTIDTSPDSLTAGEPPVGNEAAPAEVENSATPDMSNNTASNIQ